MQEENVKKVKTIRRIDNAPWQIIVYVGFSFAGNNFIKLERVSSSGNSLGEKNYNLDQVIWYEIREEWDSPGITVNALRLLR